MKFDSWLEKENMFLKNCDIDSKLICGKREELVPEVTIFIPTFKRADILKVALESALTQNYPSFEVIVVDNDSSENTPTNSLMQEYCNKYNNLCYYRNEQNLGMFGNWNRGFELARTKWLVMLHDDDILCEDYLKQVMACFKKNQCGLVSVFSKFMEFEGTKMIETDRCIRENKFKSIVSQLTKGKEKQINIYDNYRSVTATPTACAFLREAVIEVGGFNENYFPIADIVFFNKITYYYSAMILPQFLAIRRIGENEMRNILEDCPQNTIQYLRKMQSQLYKGDSKRWIADYGAGVNHLIFLASKYAPETDIEEVLKKCGISSLWNKVPRKVLRLIMAWFWLRVLVRRNCS